MKQIALPLDKLRLGGGSSLIITASNAQVIHAFANADDWPGRCAILCGPARCGKSLMALYFKNIAGGLVIDNAESAREEKVFNAWNRAQENMQPLLLVSQFQPSHWQITLADLRSRLASALLLNVPPPDDELVMQLIQKHLADRGTVIGPEALAYVTKRAERSYSAIEKFARDANALALAENSAINLPIVKRVIV